VTNNIESIILNKGPILTSEIIESMRTSGSILTDEAIRQKLSRLKDGIYKVKGYFAHRQTLFFDPEIYGSEEYYNGLREALEKAGKQYAYIINAIDFHYGSLPISQAAAYGVNPIINTKGHVTFQTALDKLVALKIVGIANDEIRLHHHASRNSGNQKHARAIQLAKDVLLLQFSDWSRKIGVTAFNSAKYYSDFYNYSFAFVSPSYIGPLVKIEAGKIKPAFVVADILIGNKITVNQVDFFIKKVDILKSMKNVAPFIPFLIVDNVEPDALALLKSKGIVIGFVNQLFGSQYAELLEALVKGVTNAGAMLKKNPEHFIDLLTKLNALVTGKTNNLRGDLFEMAVGYYHSKMGCGILDIGKEIYWEMEQRELDVYALYGNKIVVAECKGYNSQVTKADIELWCSDKIPLIRNWILNAASLSDKEIVFQYWSTGGFDDEATALINVIEQKTKKHKLEFYDQAKMVEKSKEAKSKKFTEILNEYFIKEF
jgi:hypothetical protein